MWVSFWVVLEPGADRPYVSTSPPSPERAAALRARGCCIEQVVAEFPGWAVEDGIVRAVNVDAG